MNVRLHIDRVVLEGLPLGAQDARRMRAALETELTLLIRGSSLRNEFASGGAYPRFPSIPLVIPKGTAAPELGRYIARALYQGIGR